MKKMVKWFFFGLIAISFSFTYTYAYAEQKTITLAWDANSESNLAGYKAYVADTTNGPYTEFGDVLVGTETINYVCDIPDGVVIQKFFVVTAYNEEEESGYSNEANKIYNSSRRRAMIIH